MQKPRRALEFSANHLLLRETNAANFFTNVPTFGNEPVVLPYAAVQ